MGDGACHECPNKCSHTTHYHSKVGLRLAKISVQDILDEEENEALGCSASADGSAAELAPASFPPTAALPSSLKPSSLFGSLKIIYRRLFTVTNKRLFLISRV